MNLEEALSGLRALLGVPPDQRGGQWAYDVCKATREVHEPVWQELPPTKYVENHVLPTLRDAHVAVAAVPHEGRFADKIDGFAANIDWRRAQGERYVQGLGPEDPPPDLIAAALTSKHMRELEDISVDDV